MIHFPRWPGPRMRIGGRYLRPLTFRIGLALIAGASLALALSPSKPRLITIEAHLIEHRIGESLTLARSKATLFFGQKAELKLALRKGSIDYELSSPVSQFPFESVHIEANGPEQETLRLELQAELDSDGELIAVQYKCRVEWGSRVPILSTQNGGRALLELGRATIVVDEKAPWTITDGDRESGEYRASTERVRLGLELRVCHSRQD